MAPGYAVDNIRSKGAFNMINRSDEMYIHDMTSMKDGRDVIPQGLIERIEDRIMDDLDRLEKMMFDLTIDR